MISVCARCAAYGIRMQPARYRRIASYGAAQRHYHCQTGVHGYRPRHRHFLPSENHGNTLQIDQSKLYRLVEAYRGHGHKAAQTNPYRLLPTPLVPELEPSRYGLNPNESISADGILQDLDIKTVQDAVDALKAAYCGPISTDVSYLEDAEERDWVSSRLEQIITEPVTDSETKSIALEMLKSQALDHFLANKFSTFKRYGNEGAESTMAFFLEVINGASKAGVQQIVMGMTHRGRLNLLIGLLQMDPKILFRKLKGQSEFPDSTKATGDVISHLTMECPQDIHLFRHSVAPSLERLTGAGLGVDVRSVAMDFEPEVEEFLRYPNPNENK